MNVVILVPWRGGDPHRERVWKFIKASYAVHGWPIFEGASPDGPFNRSAALNDAARKAGDWEIALIVDADSHAPIKQVHAAVERAAETGRLVIAHSQWRGLSREATKTILGGYRSSWVRLPYQTLPRATVSSCLAVPRSLWETVGGFDERFQGWGFEDRAFAIACKTFAGYERIAGPVYHLWHPSARVHRGPEYTRNRALRTRYGLVDGDAVAMRALLDE